MSIFNHIDLLLCLTLELLFLRRCRLIDNDFGKKKGNLSPTIAQTEYYNILSLLSKFLNTRVQVTISTIKLFDDNYFFWFIFVLDEQIASYKFTADVSVQLP